MRSMIIPLARLYFKIRSWRPLWFYVLNRKGRQLHNVHKKKNIFLDPVQKKVAEDLKRDGIAVTTVEEFFPGQNLMPSLLAHTKEKIGVAEVKTHKEFLKNLWDAVPTVSFDNPFFRLALQERLLSIVNEYMGLAAKFYYMVLNVTMPVKSGSEPVQSQRWHRDPEDRKMCKVFIYLNDIDEDAGPFTYILGSHREGVLGRLFLQSPPRGSLPKEDDLMKAIPKEVLKTFTGKAGTMIFCDTVGIHKGGYATRKERVMFTVGFCSEASVWPGERYSFSEDFEEQSKKEKLSRLQKHALSYKPGRISSYLFKKIKKNVIY